MKDDDCIILREALVKYLTWEAFWNVCCPGSTSTMWSMC